MTVPVGQPTRDTRFSVILRLALVAVLVLAGNRLTASITLPVVPGLLVLAGYFAVLILVPAFTGNAICDHIDRRKERRRSRT